jgi:5-methylcytosine-specific restriction endonuclease McrA
MPLDNENIKTMLEIIKINQVIMLNIINKEEKPIPEPIVEDNKKEEDDFNKLNKEQRDNLEKAKIIHESIPIKRKYTKKSISATMRRKVWDEYIGKKIGEAKCLCCKMTDITQLTFHCGHIIPECNGGELILSNLKPICQNCNSSMGTKNMDDFMKTFE